MEAFIGPNSPLYKIWRALRFLFKGGNWPYLIVALVVFSIYSYQELNREALAFQFINTKYGVGDALALSQLCAENEIKCIAVSLEKQKYMDSLSSSFGWDLLRSLTAFFLTCKFYDGILRIYNQQEEEPVPLGIGASLSIPLKIVGGGLVWLLLFLPILLSLSVKNQEIFLRGWYLFWFFFLPAILMCILTSEEFMTMLRPQDWVRTVIGVGFWRYVGIVLLPFAIWLLLIMLTVKVFGPLLREPLFTAVIVNMISITCTGMGFLYIGFFMAADEEKPKELDFASQEILGEARKYHLIGNLEAQQAFASEMRTVDYLFAQQGSEQAEAILLNYVGDDYPVDVYFPAYRRLYHYYRQQRNQGRLQELLQRLQRCAADGDESSYQLIRPELEKRADIEPERIPPDLVHPLCQLALRLEDYDMVLALTRNFAQRAPEHKQIADNYHLAARALARSGRAAAAQQLLEQLLQRFPDHPRRAAFQRTLEQIRSA